MTALTTRDALAKALVALLDSDAETPEQAADYLFASGAVIDAATLADDEALVGDLSLAVMDYNADLADRQPPKAAWDECDEDVRIMLRALPAALTERGAQ